MLAYGKKPSLNASDPSKEITLQPETLNVYNHGDRRVGQPRKKCYKVTIADFWEEAKQQFETIQNEGPCDLDNPTHMEHIRKSTKFTTKTHIHRMHSNSTTRRRCATHAARIWPTRKRHTRNTTQTLLISQQQLILSTVLVQVLSMVKEDCP